MRDPFLRSFFSGNDPTTESWLNRVRENLGQLLIPSHFKPSSANGAPIHLLKFDKSLRPVRAQGASLITHCAVFAALLFLLAHGPRVTVTPGVNDSKPPSHLTFPGAVFHTLTNAQPSGGR